MSVPAPLPSPAALIAEIPGILGFHPAYSVVFMLLKRVDNSTCSLGPVLRMDVGDSNSLPDITACINSFGADTVFAVVVAESSNYPFISEVVTASIDNLDVVWHCRGISEDECYTALWTDRPASTYHPSFLAGLIAPVHAAVSTKELLSKGDLIAPDRDEALDPLQFDPARSEEGEALMRHAAELLDEVGAVHDLILPLRQDLTAGRRIEAQARLVAVMMASADVRDLALGELLSWPELAEELLTDLAQQLLNSDLGQAHSVCWTACYWPVDTTPAPAWLSRLLAPRLATIGSRSCLWRHLWLVCA
ncbi:DUF4192 family protein [Arcanobacterium pluranimalium]|uniref:DUF4192 family protein n=1 Tax=Arcanobacterium pluranimalium TaxID=108028 RepID=UPI00195A561C|nr:DUF4192 family protein [Arcanobacterium pluranimalium]